MIVMVHKQQYTYADRQKHSTEHSQRDPGETGIRTYMVALAQGEIVAKYTPITNNIGAIGRQEHTRQTKGHAFHHLFAITPAYALFRLLWCVLSCVLSFFLFFFQFAQCVTCSIHTI